MEMSSFIMGIVFTIFVFICTMEMSSFIMGIVFTIFVFLLFENSKKRDLPPANYTVEIRSYNQLFKSEANLQRFESGLFDAGGYKWRLVFYPNGNKTDGGAGHISLYLKIDKSSGFLDNWSVHVNYKLFVQDKKQNNFFNRQDSEVRRFDKNKDEWGFAKFLSHQRFNQPSNGYLIKDSCVFGAEVSVIESTGKGETIYVVKNPPGRIQNWKITKFSKLDGTVQLSDEYIVEDRKWRLQLYPKGAADGKDEFLAISLALMDCKDLPPKREVYARFVLRLIEQLHQKKCERKCSKWFTTQSQAYRDSKFIKLEELRNLVDDTLTVELQFLSISDVKLH